MDVLNSPIHKVYFKYLFASLGGAIIMCVYTMIDSICIGQKVGEIGMTALTILNPIYSILFSTGLLFGVGGSVLYSYQVGKGDQKKANLYFTISFFANLFFAIIYIIVLFLLDDQILRFLGANSEVMPYAKEYLFWLKICSPFMVFAQLLGNFVRNDNHPMLSFVGTISGGITNAILDFVLVILLNLGMKGAAFATGVGCVVSTTTMCMHFVSKKNHLKFVFEPKMFSKIKEIFTCGFSSFLIDFANAILVFFMNSQLLRYSESITQGNKEVAVYGVCLTASIFFMSLYSGIGQTIQPLISKCLGAKKIDRIEQIRKYGVLTSYILGAFFMCLGFWIPKEIVRVFMKIDFESTVITLNYVPLYFSGFLFMAFNVFGIYYYQSILKKKIAFVISFCRSILISSICIYVIPLILGKTGIWAAIPISECLVCFITIGVFPHYIKELNQYKTKNPI